LDDRFPKHTVLRKDYMAYLAIALFIIVIAFEVLLVVWLPMKLSSSTMWRDQVACEEMIEHEDLLRANTIECKKRCKAMDGEIALVQESLDEIAAYLHEYKDRLSRGNIDEIVKYLNYFEGIYRSNMKGDRSFVVAEHIDASAYLGKLASSANAPAKDEVPGKQPVSEK